MERPDLAASGIKGWLFSKDRIGTSVILVFVLLFVERVLSFTRGIAFARLLGPTQYGIYTLALFVVPFMATVSSLGVQAAFARYGTRYQACGGLGWFLRKTYLLTTAVALLFVPVAILFRTEVAALIYKDGSYGNIVMVAMLSIPALLLINNLSTTFMGLKLFRSGRLVMSAQLGIYAALGITLVAISSTAMMSVIAYTLASFASVAVFLPLLVTYVRAVEPTPAPIVEARFYRNLLRFTIWYALIPVLGQVFNYVDRLSLEHLMTTFDQGAYSAVIGLCETLAAIGLAVTSVAYPHLCATWERGERDKARRDLDLAVRVLGIVLLVAGLILVVFGKWFILILLGRDYLVGASVVPFLAVYYLVTIQVQLIGIYPPLIERTYIAAIGFMVGLPSAVVLNLVLIPRLGMAGAALGTLLSYVMIWAIIVGICWRSGLLLTRRTLLVCLSCVALLLPWYAAVPAVGLVLYGCAFRTWVLSGEEREKVYGEIRRVLSRARRLVLARQ